MENILTLWHVRVSNERYYLYELYYARDEREAQQYAQAFLGKYPQFPMHRFKPLPYGFPSPTCWWTPGQITEDGRDVTPWVPEFERFDPTVFEGNIQEEASSRLLTLNQAHIALLTRDSSRKSRFIMRRATNMIRRQLAWFKRNAIALEYAHYWNFDYSKYDLFTRKPHCVYLEKGSVEEDARTSTTATATNSRP